MTLEELKETIRYMAESVHQAYHTDKAGGWWECPRAVCNAAQQAIPEVADRLAGPERREGRRE